MTPAPQLPTSTPIKSAQLRGRSGSSHLLHRYVQLDAPAVGTAAQPLLTPPPRRELIDGSREVSSDGTEIQY